MFKPSDKTDLITAGFFITVFIALGALFMLIGAAITRADSQQPAAQPINHIGLCDGVLMGGLDEDHFPQGCEWIEVVHYNRNGTEF